MARLVSEKQCEELLIAMRRKGIRQVDISKATGIHPPDVSRVCNGISLNPGHIKKVFEYVGLDSPV